MSSVNQDARGTFITSIMERRVKEEDKGEVMGLIKRDEKKTVARSFLG